MFNEQIKPTNPGGVRKRATQQVGNELATESDSIPPIPDLWKRLPERNVPAILSCVCGLLALVYAVCMYSAVTYTPRWLAFALESCPFDVAIAGFLVAASFLLGIVGIIVRSRYPTVRGLVWALGGIVIGGLALWTDLVTLSLPNNRWLP